MVWNLFPFKGDFSFGKSQKSQGTKYGLQGGWVTWVVWCYIKKLCLRRDAWVGAVSSWSCPSPVPHSCSLLNHPSSFWGGMFKLNAKSDADLLFCCLVLLNVTTIHYACSFNGICCLYWLAQWSRHCSCMHIPVHPPWLPGYMDVMQILLVILTMAALFPDRPCIINRYNIMHANM